MKLSQMIGLMAGLVSLRVAGAALNLFSQVAFAHIFEPSDVGVIMLCMSTVAFISLFATVGYPWLSFTQLPRLSAKGLDSFWPRFHGAFLRDATVATLVIYAVIILAMVYYPMPVGTHLALVFGCICAPASMVLRYDSAVANSVRRFSLSFVPDFIFRPSLLLIVILGAYAVGWSLTIVHAMIAFVIVMYVVTLVQGYLLGRTGVLPQYWFDARKTFTRVMRVRAVPLAFVAAVATSFSDIVTLVGGFLLPSADVASLAVAIRLAAVAGFIIQVAQQFILPDLTQAVTQRDNRLAHRLLTRLNLMTISIIIAALIGAWLLGPFALSLFGSHYVGAQNLLLAFMVAQSIRAFSGMNQQLLSMAGLQGKTVVSCLVALLLFVGCSILLVPRFGIMALGYSAIIAELAWSLMLASQAQRLTGSRGDIFWLLGKSARAYP
jgi:O-antigen/teichoic acid export membrane protein